MNITSVSVGVFSFPSRRAVDSAGHAHPGEEKPVRMAMLRIACDDGSEGFSFGPPELIRPHIIESFVKKVLIGQNPMNREKIWQELAHWQRGSASQFTDRALALVEQALWDLAGRAFKLPVHKLLGGYRDK
ncbi:mandelate racemase/muconate lactonizing protein, partial [Pseudomonas syringae pv. actinidiae ICMP 19079]